jgi:hypothetical protein
MTPLKYDRWSGDLENLRMLKQARLLTRPTLARRDAPCPKQGRSERRGEEVETAFRVGRSPIACILANGTPTGSGCRDPALTGKSGGRAETRSILGVPRVPWSKWGRRRPPRCEAGNVHDGAGLRIVATELTNRASYKNGASSRDIYRTFKPGLDGTPMPSYAGQSVGKEAQIWHVGNYILSLSAESRL